VRVLDAAALELSQDVALQPAGGRPEVDGVAPASRLALTRGAWGELSRVLSPRFA
jgi:hypothetical protein